MPGDKRFNHPTYGMISFGKIQSTGSTLFGSNLNHGTYISLDIMEATLERSGTGRDTYYPGKNLVRVYMSHHQFAEAITTHNTTGIPCTIARVANEDRGDVPPVETRQKIAQQAMTERLGRFVDRFKAQSDEVRGIINGPKPPNKAQLKTILDTLNFFSTELRSNLPFFAEQFEEVMGVVLSEVKSEVEGFLQTRATELGIDVIRVHGLEGPTKVEDTPFEITESTTSNDQ